MMMMSKLRVAVLMGGPSAEREVSLRTGAAVAEALEGAGHRVTKVDVRGPDFVIQQPCDVAFVALHGTFGEDGQVQRILEERRIAYTGCGPEASERAFDKVQTKKALVAAGVPTPPYEVLRSGQMPSMAPPFVVKPAKQGSSVGIGRVWEESQIAAALQEAFRFDDAVLVEKMIVGKELTVGILGETVLPVVHIEPVDGFYDFEHKYTPGRTLYHCPAQLTNGSARHAQEAAAAAHQALGCQVYSRVDVLLDEDCNPWVLEANTIPGMTATSLLPRAAKEAGFGFAELCEEIIKLSLDVRMP